MYAPWRLAFIEGRLTDELPRPSGCIFCDYALPLGTIPPDSTKTADGRVIPQPFRTRREWDRARLVISVRRHCFIILNKYPYQNGHVMVVPRQHTAQLEQLDAEVFLELTETLRETIAAVRDAYAPHGINVGMNMGRAAGAGIDEHVHWHVVPRWSGDTNFMPVFSDTRVISEGIEDTWDRYAQRLRRADDDENRAADAEPEVTP